MKKLLIFNLLIISTNINAWVSVGSSPGFGTCHYIKIQDAIDSGESQIRVLNNSSFTEYLRIDRSIEIRGGFTSCLSAQLNIGNGVNSIIKANDSPLRGIINDNPVIKILPSIESLPVVKLYNLTIKDAILLNGSDKGSGIDVGDSNVNLQLFKSLITNNIGINGAGILIENPEIVSVLLEDSSIIGNSATHNGGGIYCASADTEIILRNNSKVSDNQADNGGGIYATSGCHVVTECGSLNDQCTVISNNTASQLGGGVYADLGAQIEVNRAKLFSNKANIGTFAYVINYGTKLKLNNNYIYSNGSNGIDTNDYYVLISADQAKIEIKHSTIVDNDVNDFASIIGLFSSAKITLYNSIVHNNDGVLINASAAENFIISCVIVNETESVSGIGVEVLDPNFVDRINHDYHLNFNSQAIDSCAPILPSQVPLLQDIDGEPRPWDDDTRGDILGIADAGADETYINDVIFLNGLE